MLLYDWEEDSIASCRLREMRGVQIVFCRELADRYRGGRIVDCRRQ